MWRASTTTAEAVRLVLTLALAATGAVAEEGGSLRWERWDEGAFARARRESKPIFLSLGYPGCHWCGVMSREAFSDERVVRLLHERFVPVKVDRDVRPDVDRLYQEAARAAGWGGGWPLNLWLTPEREAFLGGGYFPARARDGMPGLEETLARVDQIWSERRDDALADASRLARVLKEAATPAPGSRENGEEPFRSALAALSAEHDPENGGFGDAPKFPLPGRLSLLLRLHRRTRDARALAMVRRTLRGLEDSPLHDRLAGGYHRYAADAAWRRPHYEKTLYDNAQLASLFLETYQVTGEAGYAHAAREVLDYLLSDLSRADGGFYAGQGADDSSGTEGGFYLWDSAQIDSVLGPEVGPPARAAFGVSAERGPLRAAAPPAPGFDAEAALRRLAEARSRRPRPRRDEKAIAAWNGLALSALARGAQALGEPRYLDAARRTAEALRSELYDEKSGRLSRLRGPDGRTTPGFAEDYALLATGLIDLQEATLETRWLDWASRLAATAKELFFDPRDGAFRESPAEIAAELPARPLAEQDGDLPAAGPALAHVLLRLQLMREERLLAPAEESKMTARLRALARDPASSAALAALDFRRGPIVRVALSGEDGSADLSALARVVQRRYRPDTVLVRAPGRGPAKAVVCRGRTCSLPLRRPSELRLSLDPRRKE